MKQKRHSIIIFISLFIFISIILVNISRAETPSQEPNGPANETVLTKFDVPVFIENIQKVYSDLLQNK